MIVSMICLMLSSISYSNAQSLVGKDCPNFQPCLQDGDLYRTSTCQPLQARNATWYNVCLCLNNINVGLCYNQCTSDPEAVTQGLAFQATISQSCSAVNIDPKGPLPQAPWVTPGTPTSSATGSRGSSATVPTATTSEKSSNNAQKLMSSLAGLIVVLFG
jgi:hypothetical protein